MKNTERNCKQLSKNSAVNRWHSIWKYFANSSNLVDFPWIFFFLIGGPLNSEPQIRCLTFALKPKWYWFEAKMALVSLYLDWKTWYLLAVLETCFPSYFFFQHFGKQSKFLRRKGFSRGKKITSVFGLFVLKPGIPKNCNWSKRSFPLDRSIQFEFSFCLFKFWSCQYEAFH